jgi:hypothetical protein
MHSTIRHLRSNPRPLQFAEGLPPSGREPGSRKRSKAKAAETSSNTQPTPSHSPRGLRASRTVRWNLSPTSQPFDGADQVVTAHGQQKVDQQLPQGEALREQRLVDEQLAHEHDQFQRPVSNYLFCKEIQRKDRDRRRQDREQRRCREEKESLLRPRMQVLDQAYAKSSWETFLLCVCKYSAAVVTVLIVYSLLWVWITAEAFRVRIIV